MRIHRNVRALHYHQKHCQGDDHDEGCPTLIEQRGHPVYRPKTNSTRYDRGRAPAKKDRPKSLAPTEPHVSLSMVVDQDFLAELEGAL